MIKVKRGIEIFIALNLFVLGIDKFLAFIPEPCTLLVDASTSMLYGLGVIEIVLGLLLVFGRYVNVILILVILLMVWAVAMHLVKGTYDIGGAVYIAVVSLLPLFIQDKKP